MQLNTMYNKIHQLYPLIDGNKINKIITYSNLLLKWNRVYSLTAINDIDSIIDDHILDGLSVIKAIDNTLPIINILDIGSGMGIPAIILAIYYNNVNIAAIDCNCKKTIFLQQVKIELQLTNLTIVYDKIENLNHYNIKQYSSIIKYDIITSRAFSSLVMFIDMSHNLLNNNGYLIAMKSKNVINELTKMNYNNQNNTIVIDKIEHQCTYSIQIINAEHHIANDKIRYLVKLQPQKII